MVEIFDVGFVDHDEDALGDAVDEFFDGVGVGQSSRGVVGIGDEEGFGGRGDGLNHCGDVAAVVGCRGGDYFGAE